MSNFNDYLQGDKLYGDDFTLPEIEQWYLQESEAYADMYGTNLEHEAYEFGPLTDLYSYQYIAHIPSFNCVLGFGASWGYELLPIIDKIEELHIIDPSEQTISHQLGGITPVYQKPAVSGKIPFEDNHFDLITCFGVLHHIPNVSYVFSELYRVLAPGGYLLIREPVRSMGDWRHPRPGVSRNERGIPHRLFEEMIQRAAPASVVTNYCYVCRGFFRKLFGHKCVCGKSYLLLDKWLAKRLVSNIHYHPQTFREKLAPSIVFHVIRKPEILKKSNSDNK